MSPAAQADSLPSEPAGKPTNTGVGSLSLLQGIFHVNSTRARTLSPWHTRWALGPAADRGCRGHHSMPPSTNGLARTQQLHLQGSGGTCSTQASSSLLSCTPSTSHGPPDPEILAAGRSTPAGGPRISHSTAGAALTSRLLPSTRAINKSQSLPSSPARPPPGCGTLCVATIGTPQRSGRAHV